jgi:chemotaxis protein CheX
MKTLDVAHVNPFLQSSLSVIEMTTQLKLAVGKPGISKLSFPGTSVILQVGVTGVLKGQVLLVFNEENAKMFASKMMMGMPVETFDEMASSALCELSNMIMGNTATVFASMGIAMDITPPIALHGQNLVLQTDVQALAVPMTSDGNTLLSLYLAVGQD